MRDDFLSGDWAANHTKFSVGVDKLLGQIGRGFSDTFDALTRQQFDAPWHRRWRQVKIQKIA